MFALRVTASGGSLRTPLEVVGSVIRIGGHPGSEVNLPGLGERVLLLFASQHGLHGRRLDEANLRKRFDAAEELRFTIGPYRIVARREEPTEGRGPVRSSLSPIVVIEGHSRKEAKLSRPITLIGRSELNDIALRHHGVSRVHAALLWDGTQLAVVDLFSANGTQVDSANSDYVLLSNGQVLTVDDVTLRVRTPSRELAVDIVPEERSTSVEAPTDSTDAIAQDLSDEKQGETVASVDEVGALNGAATSDPVPDLASETEPEPLVQQQQTESASQPSVDEPTIDWEPLADLEPIDATSSLPGTEPPREISDELELEKDAVDLNHAPKEEVLAEQIKSDSDIAPLQESATEAASQAEIEELELWGDLLAADLLERTAQRRVSIADGLPAEFYDELPVSRGNRLHSPATDEDSFADIADELVDPSDGHSRVHTHYNGGV
jgi:pSer/pThr/pTyr-binding forkhead associated (FHA) protein